MGTISRINHIAIVVHSISQVRSFYEDALGLKITSEEELLDRGIKTAFITVGECTIELIEPLNETSEVAKFLKTRGPGLHHVAFTTPNIREFEDKLRTKKVELTYQEARAGAHGTLVNFIHPRSAQGTLFEIVE